MHTDFSRLMTEATRLTRAGNLQAATAAIQAALASGGAPGSASSAGADASAGGDVIDVPSRVVDSPVDAANTTVLPAQPQPKPQPQTTQHPATARPATAPPQGAAGTFTAGQHTGASGARDYKLYLPPALDTLAPGQTVPLVVMLHGCTQTPDDFAAGTGMNAAARAQGCVVLYPAQSNSANPGRCWNWFKHNHQQRGKGEPALLADMTRAVMARYPVDPQRVYVAGLSAGGAMAAILGDAYPDLFAAVGVHSGLATGAAHSAQSAFAAMQGPAAPTPPRATAGRKPPTIVFHGDADTTVHPANGEQVVAPLAASVGLPPRHERLHLNGRDTLRRTWFDAHEQTVAEHWAVHGAGHAWQGGSSAGTFADPTGPSATHEMLRFFWAHPQPGVGAA